MNIVIKSLSFIGFSQVCGIFRTVILLLGSGRDEFGVIKIYLTWKSTYSEIDLGRILLGVLLVS
jgi:hypothetical protein